MFLASACLGSQGTAQTWSPAKAKAAHKAKAAPAAHVVKAREPVAKPAEAPVAVARESVNKRDPFAPLISQRKDAGGGLHLPPGKAGLVISTVRVDGAVHSPSGMIAVVSNPENSVYFIHEGDRLYDGDVEKIGLDGVTFRENSKDAFGKPVERMVTKRIYASAGEQQ
jgi:Tfp pilus assembly protein PilP